MFNGSAVDSMAELEIAAEAEYLLVQSNSNVANALNLFRHAQMQKAGIAFAPIVEVDFESLYSHWNPLLYTDQRPTKVCPLASERQLSAPAMACDKPWWSLVVSIDDSGTAVWGKYDYAVEASAVAGSILKVLDSLALLAHGLIPFKFDGDFPFMDGMCDTLCPATMTISADSLREGWRNLTAMKDLRVKMNATFPVPSSRMHLLKHTCEKMSLSRYNIDYEKPPMVCTWANVKRVLLHNHLVLKPGQRQEVDRRKEFIIRKHLLISSSKEKAGFAVLQVTSRTLDRPNRGRDDGEEDVENDEAMAVKYWTAFLESRNAVTNSIRKVLLVGDTVRTVERLYRGIESLEGALINANGISFISAVVLGEEGGGSPDLRGKKTGEGKTHIHAHDGDGGGDHSRPTPTSTAAIVFAELWAVMEIMGQLADIVVLDERSEVGELVNFVRIQYPQPKASVILIHDYLTGIERK